MNKYLKSFVAVLALSVGLLIPSLVQAQVTLTSTSLSVAITSPTANTIVVVSATGFVAGTTQVVVDMEQMNVTSVNGTTIGVTRGLNGTNATTHAAGSLAYVGSPTYFDTVGRSGSCTSTNERVLPVVVPTQGRLYTCTGSKWSWASITGGGGYLTMPVSSGGIAAVTACGATSGNANCANTQTGYTARIWQGVATLSLGSAVVSNLSPTFTSTSTGSCMGIDTSGASGVLAEVVISGVSSITVAGTGSGTVSWLCVGY